MTALLEAVENQKQVYHRSHRPWKSLQDFHTSQCPTTALKYKQSLSVPRFSASAVYQLRGAVHKYDPLSRKYQSRLITYSA